MIRAPMRVSSGTCMKRFSKIVSVIIAAPSATHISAMNCACRSVGKPGKGSVITSTPCSSPFAHPAMKPSALSASSTPASRSLSRGAAEQLEPGVLAARRARR